MLARQLTYITYVRGSMSTLQILLFLYFYGFMPPTLSREEPKVLTNLSKCLTFIYRMCYNYVAVMQLFLVCHGQAAR